MKRIASQLMVIGLSYLLCVPINAQQQAVQQQIVPDGKTNTTVKVNGKTTDVTTSTVQGTVAYNSFSTFNVAKGNTVDLVLPSGSLDLLNLVNSQAINIWGVLNSIQNGKIGGNVLFADPFGMVVGKSGSVNVGALMLITPTEAFMDSLFTAGAPSAANTSALLSGAVPISSDGMILVQGRINTITDAVLIGQNVTNSGKIASGAVFASSQPDFSDVVNVNGLVAGNALSTQNGNIEIVAQGDFQNSGQVSTNGANGLNAGNISIQAGNDVTVSSGSLISASGEGRNSNAGSIKILAGHNGEFDKGAMIAASGGNVSGNGGAIEFSAKNTVTLDGGNFAAGALHGQAGSVLIDPTTLDITASTSTNGGPFIANTGDTILVEPGVTISTQQAGGNSGDISLTTLNTTGVPQQINVGNCTGSCAPTVLNASAATGFTAGDVKIAAGTPGLPDNPSASVIIGSNATILGNAVTIAATSSVTKTWDPSSPDPNFNVDQANASVIIEPNATISGNTVSITANATTSKTATITETAGGGQAQAPDALCIIVGGAGSCGSNSSPVSITDNILGGLAGNQYSSGDNTVTSGWAGGVVSKATSNIEVGSGAQITATGKVTIDSEASSTASMTANGLYFTYAESDASATAEVLSGATITAGGDFDLTANSTNTLTNNGQAVSGQPNLTNSMITQMGPSIAVTYSVGNSTSIAGVESGATVSADNVNVKAENDNSFTTTAQPSVNTGGTCSTCNNQFGAGVAIAVSDTSSSADAHLNGAVTATGTITSDAESLDNTNQITADAEVNNNSLTGNDNADDAVKYFQKNLGSNSSSNPGSNAQDSNPTFNLGAALAIVSDSNKASSTVGPNATITSGAGQNITIEANASDTFAASATGSADQASVSIGGAVAITDYTNSATASVGQGATVNAGGTLDVTATAELPNAAASDLESIETYLETFSVSGAVSDLGNFVDSLGKDLTSTSGIKNSIITPITNAYDAFTSGLSSSLSSTGQPAGNGIGVAGTVNLLTANNTATAFVDQNAMVNAEAATVNATATTASVNAAGTAGAQQMSTFQKVFGSDNGDTGLGGFGGTYSGITYNNTANSYIADGAKVTTTTGDVDVTSSATNFMADKFASGADSGPGGDIALSGAISNITINSYSYASIDDSAIVKSAGNVKVDAENSTRVYEIGDNTDSAGTVSAGVVLGFTNVNNTTEGFIGDNDAVTGETTTGPAGSVTAGGSTGVSVIANAYERLVALDASKVSSSSAPTNSGASGTTSTPSAGSTSGTNNTSDANPTTSTANIAQGSGDGFGISGDIAFNNVTDVTKGYISDGVTVNSIATSVSATDNSLLLAADGGLVRESTAGLQAAFADNSINKTTEAYTNGVVIDTGSLSVTSNSSDVVIAAAAGGTVPNGSSSTAEIAGSVDYNNITNTTSALVDGTTVGGQTSSSPTGNVTISADNRDTVFSIAGAFAYNSGDVGVGVSLDLGVLNNTVEAGVGTGSVINSNGNVAVTASGDENQLSISADLAVTGDTDIAASVSWQSLTKDVDAYIANGATVKTTGGEVSVTANDDQGGSSLGLPSGLIEIAGSVGEGSSDVGLGASASVNTTEKTIAASIGNSSTVSASGDVDVTALTNDNLYLFAGGGGYGETAGFMGSAVFNTVTNNTSASIGNSTVSGDNVNVYASDSLNVVDAAGGFAGSNSASVGAGGDIEVMGTGGSPLSVSASIGSGANVTAANNVNVTADQTQTAVSVAADAGFSGDATVIGSGTVLDYNTDTFASSSGNVTAGGTLDVSADRETNLTTIAGQAALGGSAGVGIAVSFIDKSDSVYAYVGGGTVNVGGLEVSATGNDTLTPVAAGGALSEAVGVAGSAVINILNETTDAYIGEATPVPGSIPTVNSGASGPMVTAGLAGVSVTSTSNTSLTPSVAGAIGLGVDVGAATAADVTTISKNTTAEVYDAANVGSTGDVTVAATSEEAADSLGLSAAGGGYAGVAVAASVYIINDTTNALVDGGATVVANGSVGIGSNDQTDLDLLEGHISGGFAGVGAALAFADVTKNTNALVDGSVTADGDGSAINADNGTFAINYVPFGSGETAYSNQVPNKNGDFFSDPMFSGERRATPNTSPVNGLAVTATSENDFNTVAAGVAGGFVGVVTNGSILLLNNNTKSEIGTGAKIGTGTDSVLVAAGTDVGHIGSALGVAGGFVGAGAGFDVGIITNNTTADITDATVNASGNVAVNANASEDVLSLVAGVSGGFVGATGSVSVSELNDTTKAYISGNSVTAGGNLSVNSNDTTDVLLLVGAVGGGAVGVGGSVAVDLVTKNTEAYIDNGTNTTAGGSTTVAANSSEQLSDGTIAGGGGVFAGAAGAVSIESDNSATSATVGTGTDVAGNLTVSAQNTANVTGFNGTIGGALFGATAGSVDVGNIQNPTSAEIIGANASTTGGDVDVSATETRNINSEAISGGTAIGAIQASVIDWGVGAGVNTSGAGLTSGNPLNGSSYGGGSGTVYGGADSQSHSAASQGSGMLSELGGGSAGSQAESANSDLVSKTGGSPVSNAVTAPPTQGTTAEIYGGSVTSAGAVNVTASDTTNMNLTAGGASLSAVGVGASVVIASVNTQANALILDNSTISATGNVTVDASRNDYVTGATYDGQAAFLFGGGAAVTSLTDNGSTTAEVGADVTQGNLQVNADTTKNDSATAGQAAGSFGVGAGYAYSSVNEGGNTTAELDSGSQTLPAVQAVTVSASDSSTASANSTALTAGIVSVGGTEADTTINPTVDAHIAGDVQTGPGGNVQVNANGNEDAYSTATGVNDGGLSIGTGSTANATSQPTVNAYIDGTINAGGNVSVSAADPYNVDAQASTSEGSLLITVATGGNAEASSLPTVNAYFGNGANVTAGGTASINSESGGSVSSFANGSSGSLINVPGDTNASSTITNNNTAYVSGATVNAVNFSMSAQSTDSAGSIAIASNIGLGSDNATSAAALVSGTTEAHLEDYSTINASGTATIQASVAEQGSAIATTSSIGGITFNYVTATVGNQYGTVDTPVVITDAGTTINSTTSTLEADLTEALFNANAYSETTAVASNSTATTNVYVNGSPLVEVSGDITAPQKLSLIATVDNNSSDVNTDGYANAEINAGVTGNLTATANNYTTFSPQVIVNGNSTLTTNNLYIEASAPLLPGSGNPFYSNTSQAVANTVVEWVTETVQEVVDETLGWIPFIGPLIEQVTEWVTQTVQKLLQSNVSTFMNGSFVTNQGITLNNPTIIQKGGTNPELDIGANGSVVSQQGITFTNNGTDIIVNPIVNTATDMITLNTPAGFTAGSATVHDDASLQSVTIINSSTENLELNEINPFANNSGQPQVNITADPTRNNVQFNFITENSAAPITVTNNSTIADTNILLNGDINDPGGDVTMSALLGSILPLTASNQTEATTVSLTANHGSIGLSSDPLNLILVPTEATSQAAAMPATLTVLAGQNLYANLTPMEFFQAGESVPASVPVNLQSIEAGDVIDLNLNPATAVVPQLTTVTIPGETITIGILSITLPPITYTTYAETNNTVNGVYNLVQDITAGGNILVNAPAQTTLNMQPGSTITSGFENIGFTVNSNGTWSSTPIPVNYSSSIDSSNVVMQSLQQQGGNVTISGGGALTGTGTINVLNGYSNVNITNNSNANLVMNNLSFDTPVTGIVSIFGATPTLNGTYTTGGANIALTETNNPTSTISISQNGTAGNLDLAGGIGNQSGTTNLTAANTNIVNIGGGSELVESNYINLSAPAGYIGSSGTPINVQVDNGYINASSLSDIALDQVSGNLNVGTISSATGNVYLTAAGSILDALSNAVYGDNLDLTAIGGSIGASNSPLLIDATGTLTGLAQTGAFLTQTTGPMNVNNVTSNTGNIVLNTVAGNVNLGTNSIDALAPSSGPASTVTINANGSITDSTTNTAISADNIVLNSETTFGNIGAYLNPIEVWSSLNAPGVVSASAHSGNIYINETVGNMNVSTISSAAGNVYLSAAGSILDGNGSLTLVSGNNIFLDAVAGSIGTVFYPLLIDANGTLTGLAQMGAFITQTTGPMNVNNVTSNTGNIVLNTVAGNVNLGTNSVDALAPSSSPASTVTINANGNITDSTSNTAISADNIVLNSETTYGAIGTYSNPIEVVSSLYAPGVVSASTHSGNIWINETAGNMNVGTVTSQNGTVNLTTTLGSILNGDAILGNPSNVNVTAPLINLTSKGGTIGTSSAPVSVNTTSFFGGLNATAPGNIYILDPVGNLYVDSVTSTGGNVGLTTTVGDVDLDNFFGTINDQNGNTTINANGNIFNVPGFAASINAQGITLNATNGSIGAPFNPLRIYSNAGTALATPAVVQAFAKLGIYLNETLGPLYVSSITSSTSDIYIVSDGSIFNGNSSSTAVNLTGNNIDLTSIFGGIGTFSQMLVVNNRNGINTVSATASSTPTGHSVDMFANGSIFVDESSGDLISSNMIESQTGNVDLLVNNGSAWINAINVSPFGNPYTTNLGSTQHKTVTILVQGNVLNANTISSPDSLTMTVNPGKSWTTTPGTDTIRVGQADVFSTITARADVVNMPQVFALNQGSLTNDINRQTEGLHFFVSGWGNPGGDNYLTNLASNVNINVSPCPRGCSTIPAVVFNNLTTNNATINAGEEWLELVNAIIGTQGVFTTPWQTTTATYKFPLVQSATRYTPFYLFNFGSYQGTDANPSYWTIKDTNLRGYYLTQPLSTILKDLIKYYGLP
ncbi:MAG: leukotoxin LktA family filamentous adhesin [Terriglobales bacterium]|jgi:hypothetical protein